MSSKINHEGSPESFFDRVHTELCGCTYKMDFMGPFIGHVTQDRCAKHQQEWEIVQEFLRAQAAGE